MKITKTQLKELIREAIIVQLDEAQGQTTLRVLHKMLVKNAEHAGPEFQDHMYVTKKNDTIKVEPNDPYDFSPFQIRIDNGYMYIEKVSYDGSVEEVVYDGEANYATAVNVLHNDIFG